MPTEQGREGLKVFVRVRPPISTEVKLGNAVITSGGSNISVTADKTQVKCSYDHVFNENCEQTDIFNSVKPLLDDVLKGINGTVFAYGQTSAGKSHTMLGPDGGVDILKTNRHKWGLLPRAAEYLLASLATKAAEGELSYKVKASYLQIYNETVYDLLRDTNVDQRNGMTKEEVTDKDRKDKNSKDDRDRDTDARFKNKSSSMFRGEGGLKIREVSRPLSEEPEPPTVYMGAAATAHSTPHEVYVAGLSEFRISNVADVLSLLAAGTANRTMRSTDFNATSSRSHAILQLSFEIEHHGRSGQTTVSTSKLSLADLAGSEKILTSEGQDGVISLQENEYVKTKHLRELTSINTSLSCLGNVIAALTNKHRTHIPYRDSKLTRLLQDSLGGNTRTILLACVAPTEMHISETINTLQFADRAKGVMLKVRANTMVDDKAALSRANLEIYRLQNLLANALAKLEGKSGSSPFKPVPVGSMGTSTGTGGLGSPQTSGLESYINGEGSSIEYFIQENTRLREEVFELRATMEQQQRSIQVPVGGKKKNKTEKSKDTNKFKEKENEPTSARQQRHVCGRKQCVGDDIDEDEEDDERARDRGDYNMDKHDNERVKESELFRANRKQEKQRRKQQRKANMSTGVGAGVELDPLATLGVGSEHIASRMGMGMGMGAIAPPKVYGSSTSLKALRKVQGQGLGVGLGDKDPYDMRAHAHTHTFDNNTSSNGNGNGKEYFNGFLSSATGAPGSLGAGVGLGLGLSAGLGGKKHPLAAATFNPYTGEAIGASASTSSGSGTNGKIKTSKSAKSHSHSNNILQPTATAPATTHSNTSPSRIRMETERLALERAYQDAQTELRNESGMLENILAQRMSLERQLKEISLSTSIDTTSSVNTEAVAAAIAVATEQRQSTRSSHSSSRPKHNLPAGVTPIIVDNPVDAVEGEVRVNVNVNTDTTAYIGGDIEVATDNLVGRFTHNGQPLSDDMYSSQDFAPLSLDSADAGIVMGNVALMENVGFVPKNPTFKNSNSGCGRDSAGSASGDKENSSHNGIGNGNTLKAPIRSFSDLLSPKQRTQREEKEKEKAFEKANANAHAALMRENIQQASAAQGLPSPIKSPTREREMEPVQRNSSASTSADINVNANMYGNNRSNNNSNNSSRRNSADGSSTNMMTSIIDNDKAAGLLYTTKDVGRIVQQFSFRHNAWVDMRVDLYDEESRMHMLTNVNDNTAQMQDLRKKPIRLL